MAEGIRISEFEEAETLQDGSCFPVVSKGINKRITKATLFDLFKNEMKNEMKTFILETYYPVGALYLTMGNENPGTLFGGTWEKSNMYAVPVGSGGNDNTNPIKWKYGRNDKYIIIAWKRTN